MSPSHTHFPSFTSPWIFFIAVQQLCFFRNPCSSSPQFASTCGSNTSSSHICFIRSQRVGIPNGRNSFFPSLGIHVRRIGSAFPSSFSSSAFSIQFTSSSFTIPDVFHPLFLDTSFNAVHLNMADLIACFCTRCISSIRPWIARS